MKFMDKSLFFLFSVFSFTIANAQNNVVVSGNQAVGSGGKSSYTVGQIAYSSQTGSNGSLIQGMQQPFEIWVLSNPELQAIALSVYPNPSKNSLHLISPEQFDTTDVYYNLVDISGKIIKQNNKVESDDELIQMDNLPTGYYILSISKNNKILKSFKILKN